MEPHPPVAARLPATERVIVSVGGHTIGADLHMLAADSRPPVVFIHGIMASLALATELFAAPDRESWIAISLPGHHPGGFAPHLRPGAIDAALFGELVESALERLIGGRRVIAAGWSTGGFAAVNLAIRHPRRVAAVASLAGFASGRLTGIIGWMQWLAGQPGGREILRRALTAGGRLPALHDAIVRLCAADRAGGAALSATVLASMRRDFARHDPAAIATLLAALPAIDIGDRLAEVRVPTWVAAGGLDPIVPLAETLRLARGIPGAELRVYERGGHLFFGEWPGFRADFTAWREALPAAGGGPP